jgi:LysM repeat protein
MEAPGVDLNLRRVPRQGRGGVLIRLLVILVLAAGVVGGALYFAYEMFWKAEKLDRIEAVEIAQQAALPPPPHPSLAELARAVAALRDGRTEEADGRLAAIVESDPAAPAAPDARALLGEIRMRALLSPGVAEGKTVYSVVKGDSLARISKKTGASPELLFRANNLETINLQIGQTLLIPEPDLRLLVSPATKTLTLLNHNAFLKEYPLEGAGGPGLSPGASLSVADKIASIGDKRVAFGDTDFAATEKLILLQPGGSSIRPMPAGAGTPPPGIILSPADMDEIYVLVSRGTPVSILPATQ